MNAQKIKKTKNIKIGNKEIPLFTVIVLVLDIFIFIGSIVSAIFNSNASSRSRSIFNAFESILMFGLIALPHFINKITKLKIPPVMEICFLVFCTASIVLGDVFDFYGKITWWDSLLHSFSGVLFGILGYVIINTFNKYENGTIRFSPIFVCAWVICFAVAMGAIWELFEFAFDELFGTNAQQFLEGRGTLDGGDPLVGHEALRDTMKDLLLDFLGAIVAAVIGYFELSRLKKGLKTGGMATAYLEKDMQYYDENGNLIPSQREKLIRKNGKASDKNAIGEAKNLTPDTQKSKEIAEEKSEGMKDVSQTKK